MKFYVLSDSSDTYQGMRMAGMEGEQIADEKALREALDRLSRDPQIGVIILTEGLASLLPELITEWKLKRRQPLLVEIPDRRNSAEASAHIAEYIASSIGIRI